MCRVDIVHSIVCGSTGYSGAHWIAEQYSAAQHYIVVDWQAIWRLSAQRSLEQYSL